MSGFPLFRFLYRLDFELRQKARRTQLATHESLKLLAHPAAVYEASLFLSLFAT